MLTASVLAVVAGSPAQAANTSSEALVDHDQDASTAAVREFGGRDRYDTALRLADNFGTAKGLGNVPVAFVASGLALVDAVSVAGLAGFFDAPVLLTQGDTLHGGVADFIEDYGVQTVYILGGAGAVSDEVAEDIEALANEPTVSRISGADRYATAAAAASKLGGGAAWCGAEDPAALLANGGDVSLAEAMMVGPIAHRLQLPLLLTAADELPMATADFIEAEDIEHVVIVGGTDAVSDDVATALSDSGVDTVDRIAGDTPAGTSVELAGLLTGDCKDDLAPTAGATVALVSQDGLPDGVSASPVLSSTYADGDLVPILVVGDTLPASARDYLAATPSEDADGNKVNLSIVAIGGAGAVSQNVMDAALAAAASADGLTVQIGSGGLSTDSDRNGDTNDDGKIDADDAVVVGDDRIILYFSDDVIALDDGLEGKVRDAMELNSAPARLAAANEVTQDVGTTPACDPDSVTVTFLNALNAGDTVSVVGGFKLGDAGDQRTVSGTSLTIPAPAADRTRPTISVIMIAGREEAEVTVSMGDPALAAGTEITLRNRTAGSTNAVSVVDGDLNFTDNLVAGDRVTIPSGAVEDAAGNKSLQRSFTAIAPHKSPRITAITMSNLKHSAQAATEVPTDIAGDTVTGEAGISVTAKADGAAAGAAGNVWSMVFDVASTWEADPDAAVDIDVRVNSRDKTVFVRFNTGDAKFGDLKAELEGNSAFDAMFEVKLPPNDEGGCNATLNEPLAIDNGDRQVDDADLAGGMTQVAIEVRFNGYLQTVADAHAGLLDDILNDTAKRNMLVDGDGNTDDTDVRTALGLTTVPDAAFSAPSTTVRYEAITDNAAMLPQVRDLVTTLAGADAIAEDPDTTAIELRAAVDAIATGWATDTNNAGKNAASQVRIGRSSGVMVPPTPTG
ncbi:cell wall-binding repeat-containing protein [Candidatus Poriferisodalis sp.]|uniref:cell wall-binding repeat-containing protein n=1 Tax=Candidatus Poriferisodalis sp. TaxID=3101277 RepID=UPI003B5B43A1